MKNLEDVSSTIDEIGKIKTKFTKKEIALKILKMFLTCIFFPFVLLFLLAKRIFKGVSVRFSIKSTVSFVVIYSALIIIYMIILLASVKIYANQNGLGNDFFAGLAVGSVIYLIIFIVVGSVAGTIISSALLIPIRKITKQIENVNSENLTLKIEKVDSQEEIIELVKCLNTTLNSLENAFKQQSSFVSDASHELKTPLAVIYGYSNLLIRWGKTDTAILDEAIEAIKRESDYMNKIVEQMLFLTKLGRLNANKQRVDLFKAVSEVVEAYKVTNPNCEIVLVNDSQAIVETDLQLLTEAVRAITDNAIKYSRGKVKVSIFNDTSNYIISIKDNGLGIDQKDLPFIFDRFYCCDKTRGREKGSAGLGLAICKSIIDVIDAKIEVVSKKNEGSEFKIILPN